MDESLGIGEHTGVGNDDARSVARDAARAKSEPRAVRRRRDLRGEFLGRFDHDGFAVVEAAALTISVAAPSLMARRFTSRCGNGISIDAARSFLSIAVSS